MYAAKLGSLSLVQCKGHHDADYSCSYVNLKIVLYVEPLTIKFDRATQPLNLTFDMELIVIK